MSGCEHSWIQLSIDGRRLLRCATEDAYEARYKCTKCAAIGFNRMTGTEIDASFGGLRGFKHDDVARALNGRPKSTRFYPEGYPGGAQ